MWEIWCPVQETGRLMLFPGDSHIIRESWHICKRESELYVVHFEITRKVKCGEFNEFFMRGTLGSTQYHKTVRKTGKC